MGGRQACRWGAGVQMACRWGVEFSSTILYAYVYSAAGKPGSLLGFVAEEGYFINGLLS
jgi:hypothetical protein